MWPRDKIKNGLGDKCSLGATLVASEEKLLYALG